MCALGAMACSNGADDEAVSESNGAFAENAPVACTKAPCAERPVIWVHGHAGNPHDATYPLHRFVHWMAHEDGWVTDTD